MYKQIISGKRPACMYVLVGMPLCVCVCVCVCVHAGLSDYREKYGSISMSF